MKPRARVLALRKRLDEAARRNGVRKVRAFGSLARDRTAVRDVDLLVDLAPGRTLLDLIGFKQDAEAILGLPVDVATPTILHPRIRARVLREARPLSELSRTAPRG